MKHDFNKLLEFENFSEFIHLDLIKVDITAIRKCFEFAKEAHKNDTLKRGIPFIIHPIEVTRVITSEIGLSDTESIICALLHDVVEDTEFDSEYIKHEFGEKVAFIVDGLTKAKSIYQDNSTIQAETLKKVIMTIPQDIRVILIKIADRLQNLRTMDVMPDKTRRKKSAEALRIYAPLAHRFGFYSIKKEMENHAFRYYSPLKYDQIERLLLEHAAERDNCFEKFKKTMSKILDKNNISHSIELRTKSNYSIWRKLQERKIHFNELHNYFSIRIVFKPTAYESEIIDSYKILALVRQNYNLKAEIRDYIHCPRSNDYEGLHFNIIWTQAKILEIQILSERMHEISDNGILAIQKFKTIYPLNSQIEHFINELQTEIETSEISPLNFLKEFRQNLFTSDIYVYTPKGEIKVLPVGATVLDLAFEIHSDFGLHCNGALINDSKAVGINYVLNQGEIVEIVHKKYIFPEYSWLDLVKSSKAKKVISRYFAGKKRQFENIGRKKFVEFISQHSQNIDSFEIEQKIVKELNFVHEDDLYFSIGINKIQKQDLKRIVQGELMHNIEYVGIEIEKDAKRSEAFDLKIRQMDIRFADCCLPIPGDDIAGYIDNNRIVIHRRDCGIAIELLSEQSQNLVPVTWSSSTKKSFSAGIKVEGIDRMRMIRDITNVISNQLEANIKSFNVFADNGRFEGRIEVFITSLDALENIMNRLKQIEDITCVERLEKL